MNLSRRVLLSTAIRLFGLGGAFLLGPVRALGQWRTPSWSVRRATGADAASLPEIFNTHLEAGLCPYGDQIEPWTVEKAVEFLEGHNGTLILEHNGESHALQLPPHFRSENLGTGGLRGVGRLRRSFEARTAGHAFARSPCSTPRYRLPCF